MSAQSAAEARLIHDNEVPGLPSTWHVERFRFLFRESKERNGLEPVGDMLSVSEYRGVVPRQYDDQESRRSNEELETYRVVRPGQLAVNTMWLNHLGLGVSDHLGHVSPAYSVFEISDRLNARFVHHLLRSQFYLKIYLRYLYGIRPNSFQIKANDWGSIPIIVPPMTDQNAIVDFLDRETTLIDELIAKKRRLIDVYGEREEAGFHQAITGKSIVGPTGESGVDWIGQIPSHWLAPKFVHVAKQETGHTPSRKEDAYWVPEERTIPWVSLADVWQLRDGSTVYIKDTSEKISPLGMANSAARLLPAQTVILSRTASVGFAGILAVPMATTQDFVGWICSKKIRPKYMYFVLRAMKPVFRRLMMGSTHQTIYMPDIRSFRLPLPPIQEQDAIIAELEQAVGTFRATAAKLQTSVDKLREFRSALITAAVTGQIDVTTWGKQGQTDRRLDKIQEEMGA